MGVGRDLDTPYASDGDGDAIRNTQRTNVHMTTKFITGEYFRLLEAVEQFYFDLVKIILNYSANCHACAILNLF